MKARWFRLVLALVGATVLIGAACSSNNDTSGGSTGGSGESPVAPENLTGTVRIFSFEDELVPQVLGPFKKANPNLNVETATFSSSDEAVTKLQAGFQADIVNVCVRDTQRLADLNLIQPIDTAKVADWDK